MARLICPNMKKEKGRTMSELFKVLGKQFKPQYNETILPFNIIS